MKTFLLCGSCFTVAAAMAQGPAPDALWYLQDQLVQVMTGGTEVQRINLQPFGLVPSRAFPAPDGRIWLSTAPLGRLYLVDPGPPAQVSGPLPLPQGSSGVAQFVDFAANGDAWIVYADGYVQSFHPVGQPGQLLQVAAAPVGAAFDHFGKLWIGHRDGLLSRLDPSTGLAQTFQLPLAANRHLGGIRIAPPATVSGTNGFTLGALWAVDDGNTLFMLDLTGSLQATWLLGSGILPTTPAVDRDGQAWVGIGSQVYGFTADGAGLVAGFVFPGVQVRSIDFEAKGQMLVQKLDPLRGTSEIDATDPSTGAALTHIDLPFAFGNDPARWYHALVVDRTGDADGDGVDNATEVRQGTSPFDPQSHMGRRLEIQGQQRIGSAVTLSVDVGPVVFAAAANLAAIPLSIAGLGDLRIDAASLGAVLVTPANYVTLAVPNDPALSGLGMVFQALQLPSPGIAAALTNAVDLRLGM